MRNSHSTSMARSAASTTHSQLMTHSTIAEGYGFNRARSSESTEDALAGKPSAAAAALTVATSFDASEAEDRGVPMSPKKLPPTPPRDHGSPYRPQAAAAAVSSSQHPSQDRFLQPRSTFQPFLSSSTSSSQQPFLRPSSWRHKEEDHGASIFRDSSGHDSMSREHQGFYTIQRSYAFDEDDESDSEF